MKYITDKIFKDSTKEELVKYFEEIIESFIIRDKMLVEENKKLKGIKRD